MFYMALFGKKSIAGVEIDSYEVRAVEVGGTLESPVLMTVGRAAIPAGAVVDGRVLKPDAVGDAMGWLWTEAGIKTRNIILGVSNQDVLLRFAFFPKVPPEKLNNMIRFQAQDFLPLPVMDVELDYAVLGEVTGERGTMLHVLLVAARKAMINDIINAVTTADLNVLDIDASNLALMRLLPAKERSRTVAMVNLTNEQAGMMIMRNGTPALSRITMVSQSNNANQGNFAVGNASGQVAAAGEEAGTAILNSALLGEIKSSIGYFQNQTRNIAIDKVMLCGCAGGKKGALDELHEGLGLNVELLDPFRSMGSASPAGRFTSSESADYAICMSLALRGLGEVRR